MDALKIDKAHVVGHSMGALTALLVGLKYPERCLSVTAAGCGYGSSPDPAVVEETREASRATARMFETEDFKAAAARYADGATRQTHKHKDPRGFAEFAADAVGAFRRRPRADHARSCRRSGRACGSSKAN